MLASAAPLSTGAGEGMRGWGDGEMRNGLGKQKPPEAVAVSHPLIPSSPHPPTHCFCKCSPTFPLTSAKCRRTFHVPGTPAVVTKLPFSPSERW
jgi:hypothetical protein